MWMKKTNVHQKTKQNFPPEEIFSTKSPPPGPSDHEQSPEWMVDVWLGLHQPLTHNSQHRLVFKGQNRRQIQVSKYTNCS